MGFRGLNHFAEQLKFNNQLIETDHFYDPVLEISELTDRISKSDQNKALLFNNNGTCFPLLINMMGSEDRICQALRVNDIREIPKRIDEIFLLAKGLSKQKKSKISLLKTIWPLTRLNPVSVNRRGACQKHIMRDPDLGVLPVLKCWPEDGGRFITLPLVHTKDPETGKRNLGMYRMQVISDKMTGMHWHLHKGGAEHFRKAAAMGQRLPVAVALGGDPVYTYAATAPLPEDVDEYVFAGFVRQERVKMVKCITQDIEVPEDADIVIEGYVDPADELLWEGPFGDHTGFYSKPDWYPKFHVTCITWRDKAVYPATIVGIPPQEDFWYAKATEQIFLPLLRNSFIPELENLLLPGAGTGHNLALAVINKKFPGHAIKVMHALWGAGQMMFNKFLIAVDSSFVGLEGVSLVKKIFQHFSPLRDTFLSRGPLDVLDHASGIHVYGGKAFFDATTKLPEEMAYQLDFDPAIKKPADSKFKNGSSSFKWINDELVELGIPVVLIASKSDNPHALLKVLKKEKKSWDSNSLKMLVLMDEATRSLNWFQKIWFATNNIDPNRDLKLIDDPWFKEGILFVDATSKYKSFKEKGEDWPDIIVSCEQTINRVDHKLLQDPNFIFIESPSLCLYPLKKNH